MTVVTPLAKTVSNSILEEIIKRKHAEVLGQRTKTIPPRIRRLPVSLRDSLGQPGPGFIFECKRASPSLGDLGGKVNLETLAVDYSRFANAISVLTDKTFFKGSLKDLKIIGNMTNLPLLAKDFFIDESQIHHAYAAGADAILLMLSVLDDRTYARLSKVAKKLSMSVLTEVHTAGEMARANSLKAEIIGINNRDFKTLKVDIRTTDNLAHLARRRSVRVSESGFNDRGQVLKYGKRVHGFLIGSSLMTSERPDLKIRELVFGKVKICGLKNPESAKAAYGCGATFGGLNFVEGTPRAINPGEAKAVMADIPLKWVGVFRNTTFTYIGAVASFLDLDAVQLHGVEDDRFRQKLKRKLPIKTEIWQAVEGAKFTPEKTPKFCDRLILDTKKYQVFGGTGLSFGWAGLKKLKNKEHLGLAGGINAGNVRAAIKTGIPLLDICSGVEEARGKKSQEQIEKLFRVIREFEGF